MDIMRPHLKHQVSPAPWLVSRKNVDVPSLILKALVQSPDATVDDVVHQLRDCGVQAPGIIVSMWILKWRERMAAMRFTEDQEADQNGHSVEGELYCTCNEQPCTCGEPLPAWWYQYCCGVRVTPTQAKARDEFFEHATTP